VLGRCDVIEFVEETPKGGGEERALMILCGRIE
jgi:hypothetical protein